MVSKSGGCITFVVVKIEDIVSNYIDQLNTVQKEAVVNFEGASLIVAGAGSGKTRVLTCRIAHMLERGVPSGSILALTFTNKAAKEMRERIEQLITQPLTRGLWMGTFHSIFARILRLEAEKLGYPSSYTIYDSADAKNVVKTIIKELNLNDETYKVGDIASRISKAKNELITPQAYESNTSLIAEDREKRCPQFVDIYKLYARKCKENGAMDFDDLLLNINILFRDFPEALARYQAQFKYILVDEYQDTNVSQYIIIKKLAQHHANVCVVGDDAQSIYSFRGAKIENILRFQNDFPKVRIFKLEQNYRSTQTIVNAANSIIEKNKRQIKKKSFSAGQTGDMIKVIKAFTDREEASLIASDIYSVVRDKECGYSDVALLYRTNAQSRSIEEALRGRNIPYKIHGGFSFYQRKEVKDILSYVRLVVNVRDDEAFKRVVNTPARGIGDVTIGRIAAAAAAHSISMCEAVNTLDPKEMDLNGGAGKKVKDFAALITSLSANRATMNAYELGLEIATRSGILGSYKMQQSPEAMSALENIEELLNSIQVYTDEQQKIMDENGEQGQAVISIDEWMQNVMLLTDADTEKPEEQSRMTLMTVHAAKGLEFDYIYIVGLEENLFPSMMSMGSSEGLEEERRLFYVALTRAKVGATLSFAESRFKWGSMSFSRPSRFIGEIDSQYLDMPFDIDSEDVDDFEESGQSSCQHSSASQGAYRNSTSDRMMKYPKRGGSGSGSYDSNSDSGPYRGGSGASYGSRSGSSHPGGGVVKPTPSVAALSQSHRSLSPVGRSVKMQDSQPSALGAVPIQPTSPGGYGVGMRVSHTKFGVGMITAIEQFNGDEKLSVNFDVVGEKVLLRKYAKLTIMG